MEVVTLIFPEIFNTMKGVFFTDCMSIKVCDAIMGSGKSSAAINYMNAHPNQKFIYITPYLEEAKRIRDSCPELNFKEPSNKIPDFDFKKYKHTEELLVSGENITSTHNMFLRYSDDMTDLIKRHEYTLIVDEAVDVLRHSTVTRSDVKLLEEAGWVVNDNGVLKITPSFNYKGGVANEIVSLSKGNRLVDIPDGKTGNRYFYWLFSSDIINSFKDVFVLTYIFEAQTMKYYFDMMGISFDYIGIKRDDSGDYFFSESMQYVPEYTAHLSDMIHIFENDKLNKIGDNKHSLSYTWFKRLSGNEKNKKTLKLNVYNYFMNYHRGEPADLKLWSTYEIGKPIIRGKGFYYSGIAFNAKATNNFRNKQILAYCVNIFLQPNEKQYLLKSGVDVKEDRYALSVMIQWIWRSAIRDGKEIWLYVPSKRMRQLLRNWIGEVESEYIHIKENNK